MIIGFEFIRYYRQIVPLIITSAMIMVVGGGLASLSLNWMLLYIDKLRVYKALSLFVACIGIVLFPVSIFSSDFIGFGIFAALILLIGIISNPILTIDVFFLKDLVIYVRTLIVYLDYLYTVHIYMLLNNLNFLCESNR